MGIRSRSTSFRRPTTTPSRSTARAEPAGRAGRRRCRATRAAKFRFSSTSAVAFGHALPFESVASTSRGILAVDDYGHWLGSRKAVDEYIAEHGLPIALHRVDKTGVRVAVKLT